jgi:hypothetical protein
MNNIQISLPHPFLYPYDDDMYESRKLFSQTRFFIILNEAETNYTNKNRVDMYLNYNNTYSIIINYILINNSAGLNGGLECFLGIKFTPHIENNSYRNYFTGQYGGVIFITYPAVIIFIIDGELLLDGEFEEEITGDALYVKFCNFINYIINYMVGRNDRAIYLHVPSNTYNNFSSKIIGYKFINGKCDRRENTIFSFIQKNLEIIKSQFINCISKNNTCKKEGGLFVCQIIQNVFINVFFFEKFYTNKINKHEGTISFDKITPVEYCLGVNNSVFMNCECEKKEISWIINGKENVISKKSSILSPININFSMFLVVERALLICEYIIFLIPVNISQTLHNNSCFDHKYQNYFKIKDDKKIYLKERSYVLEMKKKEINEV